MIFVIEDERHAERHGEFPSREDAMAELKRRTGIPWDQSRNAAPCTGWRGCGRSYEIVAYDETVSPWRELSRTAALDVSAAGVRWLV